MRRPFVAANWKLNGDLDMVERLVRGTLKGIRKDLGVDVVICPPIIFAYAAHALLETTQVGLGAQNVSDQTTGAYTGEISAQMLYEAGCRWVIIGHSERRHVYGESDAMMADKFMLALQAGLKPILCVGELLSERESGKTEVVVLGQLKVVLDQVDIEAFRNAVIAYEPVWAIGTGKTATTDQAQQVHKLLRDELKRRSASIADAVRIVYGGSVKPDNAAELFAQQDIDGGLIGGASLDANQFAAIVNAAA